MSAVEEDNELDTIIVDNDTELVKLTGTKWRFTNTKRRNVTATRDSPIDVKLKIDDEVIDGHRSVLSEGSRFFRSLFNSGTATDGEPLQLLGASSDGLKLVLGYLYEGHVTLDCEIAEGCLIAAKQLEVDWLIKVGCYFLVYTSPIANFGNILDLANKHSLPLLHEELFRFLGLNIVQLHDEKQLADLSVDVLLALLSGKHYLEAPEELVLQAIIEWVNHDFQERKELLHKLITQVRFNLMNPEELDNIPSAILELDGVKERVDVSRSLWADLYGLCVVEEQDQLVPRGSTEALVALSTHSADTVQYVRPTDGFVFREQFGCSVAGVLIDHAGTASLGNFVFVVAGYDLAYGVSDRVHRYDPRFRHWLPVASLNEKRVNCALISSGSQLFVAGGSNRGQSSTRSGSDTADEDSDEVAPEPGVGETPLKSCEKYDPKANSWTYLASLPYGCFDLAGSSLNGVVYVCGGITDNPSDSVPVNHVYKLATEDDAWIQRSPMLTPRQGHSMVAFKDKLYVFGGNTTSSSDESAIALGMKMCLSNECYDPEVDQWTELASTPPSYGRLSKDVALRGDTVYLLGGKNCSCYLHEFNLEKSAWKEGTFCGDNLIKLLALKAAVPFSASTDVVSESADVVSEQSS